MVVRSAFPGHDAAAKLVDPGTGPRFGGALSSLSTRWALPVPIDQPVRISAPTRPAPPPNPGDTVNCPDFHRWADAQAWYKTYYPYYGDAARLDADHDGIACESLPGAP